MQIPTRKKLKGIGGCRASKWISTACLRFFSLVKVRSWFHPGTADPVCRCAGCWVHEGSMAGMCLELQMLPLLHWKHDLIVVGWCQAKEKAANTSLKALTGNFLWGPAPLVISEVIISLPCTELQVKFAVSIFLLLRLSSFCRAQPETRTLFRVSRRADITAAPNPETRWLIQMFFNICVPVD